MMSNISVIKAELDSNVGLYGSMTDQEVADELNNANKPRDRTSMTRNEVLNEIDNAELSGLVGDNATKVFGVLSDTVDPFGPAVQVFKDAFGDNSQTITNLALARVETVSRATILGLGEVKEGHIIEARL